MPDVTFPVLYEAGQVRLAQFGARLLALEADELPTAATALSILDLFGGLGQVALLAEGPTQLTERGYLVETYGLSAPQPVVPDVVLPTPVLTFAPLPPRLVGEGSFALSATSTNTVTPIVFASANPAVVSVALTGGTWTATVVGAGTATITASQVAGNGFGAASVAQPQAVLAPLVTAFVGAFATRTPTAAVVQGKLTQQWGREARTLALGNAPTIACAAQYPGFAEPQSQGIRAGLRDKNGFVLQEGFDYTRTAITLTVGGGPVAYWLYLHRYDQDDDAFVYQLAAL